VVEVISSKRTHIVDWKNKNGDVTFNMTFVIDGGMLTTTDDLGTNVFHFFENNADALTFEWLSGLSDDYFFKKKSSG